MVGDGDNGLTNHGTGDTVVNGSIPESESPGVEVDLHDDDDDGGVCVCDGKS